MSKDSKGDEQAPRAKIDKRATKRHAKREVADEACEKIDVAKALTRPAEGKEVRRGGNRVKNWEEDDTCGS